MSSKVIMFLGTVISVLVIYLCVYYKKDEIALFLGVDQALETQKVAAADKNDKKRDETSLEPKEEIEEIVEVNSKNEAKENVFEESPEIEKKEKVVTEKSDPAFGLMLGEMTKIVGMLTPRDRSKSLITYIENYCQEHKCDKDIRYSEDIKDVIWQKGIVKLIKFLNEERIEKGSIFVNSNVLKVEGEITSVDQKRRLTDILTSLKNDGLEVVDQSVELLINTKKPDIEQAEKVKKDEQESTKNDMQEKSSKISGNEIREKIDKILLDNPIEFDSKNSKLSQKSKETLEKIANLLNSADIKKIEVASYSQKTDDDIYQKVISQKKSDIVKKYLIKKGLTQVVSKGYGSTGFRYIENPQDPRNKRIEIKILK